MKNKAIFYLYVVLGVITLSNVIMWTLKYLNIFEPTIGIQNLLDFDGEKNIPTAYNTLLLAISGIFLLSIAIQNSKDKVAWFFLSIIFLYLSLDEIIGIHEHLTTPLSRFISPDSIFYFTWVIAGVIVVILLGLIFKKFIFNLPKETRNAFLIAGTIYIFGVLIMEMIDGAYLSHGGNTYVYKTFTTFEEFFEMLGLILFINACNNYNKHLTSK